MMDYAAVATDLRTEDVDLDRKRLDAFRLGSIPLSSSITPRAHKPSHSRSHSRHVSVSVPLVPLSASLSLSSSSPPPSPPPVTGTSKRNSHHRRRSSVSTRRESAEIMGVTLTAITTPSEDNLNLGDKDSIRRRALMALEGKTDMGAFAKVEIPELSTPDVEKKFDFPSKPSYPPGIGAGYGSGLNSLASNKRDSFGKFMSMASTKEQLGTLVEEEEEEEVAEKVKDERSVSHSEMNVVPVEDSVTLVSLSPAPVSGPARPRPATLNLRPLSLTSSNLVQATNGELPTFTPSPRPRPGLRSLTLPASLSSDSEDGLSSNSTSVSNRRQSLIMASSAAAPVPTRRPSSTFSADGHSSTVQTTRRSSISYVYSGDALASSIHGLPTPEMTPTSDRRYSQDSTGSEQSRSSRGSRPHSSSDHHFLYQAHAALVQRISDLERALSARPRSRPQSGASDSSVQSEPPNDEILQLVADLKAERDELKKDVDGWRTRVADNERQSALLIQRLESERRDAWVARERANLMEVDKKALAVILAEKISWGENAWKNYEAAQAGALKAEEECKALRAQLQRLAMLEADVVRLTASLSEEKKKREEAEKELEGLLSTPTPQVSDLAKYQTPPMSRTMIFAKRGGLGFRSVDSSGSSTDVESLDGSPDRHQLSLKAVAEEDEDDSQNASRFDCNDSQDDLARYEEEDENDNFAFHPSLSDTSFASDYEESREASQLTVVSPDEDHLPELSPCRSNSSSPAPSSPPQVHERHPSMIKAWTFPQSVEPSSQFTREAQEIDRFFGCLEDVDNSPPMDSKLRSAESEKNMFAQALADADDDFSPFMIPSHVGTEVTFADSKYALDAVLEEDEESTDVEEEENVDDEFVGQEDEGGIIFTFTPPTFNGVMTDAQLEIPSVKVEEFSVVENVEADVTNDTPAPSSPSEQAKPVPSLIPRVPSSRSFASSIPTPAPTPVKSAGKTVDSLVFSTPVKRGPSPSSIPRPHSTQPSSPPSPQISPSTKLRMASFIPQPRKSLVSMPPSAPTTIQNKPRPSMYRNSRAEPSSSFTEVRAQKHSSTTSPAVDHVSSSPFASPTFAAIQTLTNLIPSLPWTSPKFETSVSSAASALCTIPSSSSTFSIVNPGDKGNTPCVNSPLANQPPVSMQPKPRGYVPRERQLAKLKVRLEQESRLISSTSSTGSSHYRRNHNGVFDL